MAETRVDNVHDYAVASESCELPREEDVEELRDLVTVLRVELGLVVERRDRVCVRVLGEGGPEMHLTSGECEVHFKRGCRRGSWKGGGALEGGK